jgi:hypothetical protein
MSIPRPSSRSRLLLVSVGACRAESARGPQSWQIRLAEALTGQVADMRPVKLHPWTSFECLESQLVCSARLRGRRRILVLPWHLHLANDELVACATTALQRVGADPLSITVHTLKQPAIPAQGVSPAGPLGGLLPPQPRLDRLVERWPGWSQDSTLVCTGRVSILVQHASALPRDTGARSEEDGQLEQALRMSLYPDRPARKSPHLEPMLSRDGAIYARYLRDIMCAACDLLWYPLSSASLQQAEERLCQT